MASFGQLTNAFCKASQETTVAFANFNFDFTLVKYEAPEEYKGLGEALSKRRKETAEDGPLHVTARKLGALFRSIIPNVPNLIQAYGIRASDIAKLPEVNPKGSAKQSIFADHVGADGSTIWAAATSGTETVTMHLLACMLARIWTREQAVPIWSELIDERKRFLQSVVAESEAAFQISDLTAARIEITRSQLDEWDGSARAWLKTADEAKKLPQTQLRLLVDNISLPVSTHDNLYTAVIDAWTKALQALENLVKGAPQRTDNGAVLLGLSAWHLYPDILLAGSNQYIEQGDKLINPGGIITIGLKAKDDDGKGVFWSLPLANARYYGEPVMTKRYAGVGESQVSFEEFMFVTLGSVLSGWNTQDASLDSQLNLIQMLVRALRHSAQDPGLRLQHSYLRNRIKGIYSLDSAASEYARSTDIYKQQITRLISFGKRRCSKLLAPRVSHPPPVFGFVKFNILLSAFPENFSRAIALLRNWAMRELESHTIRNAVIRYRSSSYSKVFYTNLGSEALNPRKRQKSRSSNGEAHGTDMAPLNWSDNNYEIYTEEECAIDNENKLEVSIPPGPGQKPESYVFLCGDPELVAIYVPADKTARKAVENNSMTVSQVIRCIEEGDLGEAEIATALLHVCEIPAYSNYFNSLTAIEMAKKIYSKLPGAKVDLKVTSSMVSRSNWWKEFQSSECRTLQAIFSCIAYFETGIFDADPGTLGGQTFALCHANSIFVASNLLRDPMDTAPDIPVERIIGNVGKPGLAFLISPIEPKISKLDYSAWHMVSHELFDGATQSNFGGTSFHLSFTGYELPLDLDLRGGRDAPAYLLETALSVYDQGKWIADLDILRSCSQWLRVQGPNCNHSSEEKSAMSPFIPLVSVDSWLELLDPPVQNAVVRAHGNPFARLATAALAVRLAHKVVILAANPCWTCQWEKIPNLRSHPVQHSHSNCEDVQEVEGDDNVETSIDSISSPSPSPRDTYAFDLPAPEVEIEDDVKPKIIFIY